MPLTITVLDDDLIAGLENRAKKQQLSVEHFAIRILTEAVEESEPPTPREIVATIQATAPNASQVRAATANLADVLRASPGDCCFDLESWNRQWSIVEAEMKARTRANDVAEGRGG
jgi:plasmid stability protein